MDRHTTPDRDDLRRFKHLVRRWPRANRLRAVALAACDAVVDDKTALYRERDAAYLVRDRELCRIEREPIDLGIALGIVMPRYIRVGHLLASVAPHAGEMDGGERVTIIDLRRPARLAAPEAMAE